jgi:hypothetical protein
MSLKFSLLRLLIGVTALCVICAAATAFPAHFVAVGLRIAMFVPALVIAALFTVVSSRKAWVFCIAMTGAFVGYLLAPGRSAVFPSWMDRYFFDLYAATPYAFGGALVLGTAVLLTEFVHRSRAAPPIDK